MNETHTDKVLPRAYYAEKAVIAGMLFDESFFWAALDNLTEEHFYTTAFQKCFAAFTNTKKRDMVIVMPILEEAQLKDIATLSIGFSYNGESEFAELNKMLKCRKGITACYTALNGYYSPEAFDPTDTTATLAKSISELSAARVERTKVIGEMLGAEIDRQERVVKSGTTAFIKTGISDLDSLITIEQSDYIIIGARPSNGKSSLAGTIGRNVCRNGGVVYVFYLDTAKEVEVSRAVFAEARLSLSDFNRGFLKNRDCSAINKAVSTLAPMKYYLDDTPRITTDQIRAKCQRLISVENKIDLVIVDFIQNVRAPIKDIRERVSYVSEELHNLPREIGCPVIALSQMARYQKEEEEPPTLRVLKESGDLEEDADKVLLLYYPEHYRKVNDEEKNIMQVFVAKNKNGCTGYVPLNFFANRFEITNRSTTTEW